MYQHNLYPALFAAAHSILSLDRSRDAEVHADGLLVCAGCLDAPAFYPQGSVTQRVIVNGVIVGNQTVGYRA